MPATTKTYTATVGFDGLEIDAVTVSVSVPKRAAFETVQKALVSAAFEQLGARAVLSGIKSVVSMDVEDLGAAEEYVDALAGV